MHPSPPTEPAHPPPPTQASIPAFLCARPCVGQVLQPGDVAVDATCGNGHDSLFMAQAIGPTGELHAVDLQVRTFACAGNSHRQCVACNNSSQ